MSYYYYGGRRRRRFLDVPTYDIYRISADKFNVVSMTLNKATLTKEQAVALCKELSVDYPYKRRDELAGKRVKFVYVRVDEGEELEELKEKVAKINAIYKPKKEKYMAELSVKKKAEIDARAEQYNKLKEKQSEHMAIVGWHYDNQQRVNEYKGTMRG
jgi:predicted signal transduction protein with EAL and GGDEF domain